MIAAHDRQSYGLVVTWSTVVVTVSPYPSLKNDPGISELWLEFEGTTNVGFAHARSELALLVPAKASVARSVGDVRPLLNQTRSVGFLAPLPTRWVIRASWLVDDWRNPRIVCDIVAPGVWM